MKSKKEYNIAIDDNYSISIVKGPDDNFVLTHNIIVDSANEPVKIDVPGVFQSAASLSLVCESDKNINDKIVNSKKILEKIKMKQYVKLKKFSFGEVIFILTGGNFVWNEGDFAEKHISYDPEIAKEVWGDSIWEFVHDITNFYDLVIAFREYRQKFLVNGFENYISILNEKRSNIN